MQGEQRLGRLDDCGNKILKINEAERDEEDRNPLPFGKTGDDAGDKSRRVRTYPIRTKMTVGCRGNA